MKRCKHCGELKALGDFYGDSAGKDGHRPECNACTAARRKQWYEANRDREIKRVQQWRGQNADRYNEYQREHRARPDVKLKSRDAHLRRKFGITLAQYDEMLAQQGGLCAICERPPTEGISLHVDHEHGTERVRGLLCFRCNNALGDLGDDSALMARAARYLEPIVRDEHLERHIAELKALAASRP